MFGLQTEVPLWNALIYKSGLSRLVGEARCEPGAMSIFSTVVGNCGRHVDGRFKLFVSLVWELCQRMQ